jgi:hypothetical protein
MILSPGIAKLKNLARRWLEKLQQYITVLLR